MVTFILYLPVPETMKEACGHIESTYNNPYSKVTLVNIYNSAFDRKANPSIFYISHNRSPYAAHVN